MEKVNTKDQYLRHNYICEFNPRDWQGDRALQFVMDRAQEGCEKMFGVRFNEWEFCISKIIGEDNMHRLSAPVWVVNPDYKK